jgi:hypothetical protein
MQCVVPAPPRRPRNLTLTRRGRKANAPAFPGIRIPLKAEPPEPVPIWALLDVRAHHLDIGTGSPSLAALSLR